MVIQESWYSWSDFIKVSTTLPTIEAQQRSDFQSHTAKKWGSEHSNPHLPDLQSKPFSPHYANGFTRGYFYCSYFPHVPWQKRNFAEMPQNESKEGYEYTCAKIGTVARPRTFLFHCFQCCSEFLFHPTQGVKQMWKYHKVASPSVGVWFMIGTRKK